MRIELDWVVMQGLRPEIRTYNTAIIACNMCNQPLEALKVMIGWMWGLVGVEFGINEGWNVWLC